MAGGRRLRARDAPFLSSVICPHGGGGRRYAIMSEGSPGLSQGETSGARQYVSNER